MTFDAKKLGLDRIATGLSRAGARGNSRLVTGDISRGEIVEYTTSSSNVEYVQIRARATAAFPVLIDHRVVAPTTPFWTHFFGFDHQQFHLLRAAPLGVNLPPLLVGPLTPLMRAQNDLRRFAFFDPGFNVDGLSVTGGLRLEPCSRLNFARPLAFKPPFRLWRLGL